MHTNDNEDSDEKPDDTTIHPDLNVGSEHVTTIEALYCELCHQFLPLHPDQDFALQKHCNIRGHLKNYLRFKENQSLRLCAEKVHRRHKEEKSTNKDGK